MGSGAIPSQIPKDRSPERQTEQRRASKSPTLNRVVRKPSKSNYSRSNLPEIYTLIDLPEVEEKAPEGKMIKIKTSKKISYNALEGSLPPVGARK